MVIIWWALFVIWCLSFFIGGIAFVIWVFAEDRWALNTAIVGGSVFILVPILVIATVIVGIPDSMNQFFESLRPSI